MISQLTTRIATERDVDAIRKIYNQGVEDGIATLETDGKDIAYMTDWFEQHDGRFKVLVAEQDGEIVGWASLNRYSERRVFDGVAVLSIYIRRDFRGKGLGKKLLNDLEALALELQFNKIILFTLPFNVMGVGLYKKRGYREVGVLKDHGQMNGLFVDLLLMEKLLKE